MWGLRLSLLETQAVLARVYTDRAFRESFAHNAGAVCAGFDLTDSERRQLATLDLREVEAFALVLKRKRLRSVSEEAPAAARLLGEVFEHRFFDYCDLHPSAVEHVEDARGFLAFLRGSPADAHPLAVEVLRCEHARLDVLLAGDAGAGAREFAATLDLAARPTLASWARLAAFEYDMEHLYPALASGRAFAAEPDPCDVLIGRVLGSSSIRMKRINAATGRFLRMFDGSRSLGEAIQVTADSLGLRGPARTSYGAECEAFVLSLLRSDLVRLRLSSTGSSAPPKGSQAD